MDVSSRPTYKEASAEVALEAAQDFCRKCQELANGVVDDICLVEPVLTPRFVPTCSNELLSGLGKVAEENRKGEERDQRKNRCVERKESMSLNHRGPTVEYKNPWRNIAKLGN